MQSGKPACVTPCAVQRSSFDQGLSQGLSDVNQDGGADDRCSSTRSCHRTQLQRPWVLQLSAHPRQNNGCLSRRPHSCLISVCPPAHAWPEAITEPAFQPMPQEVQPAGTAFPRQHVAGHHRRRVTRHTTTHDGQRSQGHTHVQAVSGQ